MCDKVYAEFAYANRHEARGEDRSRLKYISKCFASRERPSYNDNIMDRVHDTSEDDLDVDYSEYRGETPPETP
jgi:hypothetical protein